MQPLTIKEHLKELRIRVVFILVLLFAGSLLGFYFNQQILSILIRPLNQPVFYTSPVGGFSLAIKLSFLTGFLLTLPLIIHQLFRFIEPAFAKKRTKYIYLFIISSFVLTVAGISFAYFLCLPATLSFLSNFGGKDIKSLITAQEYFSFLFSYLTGFALFFQLPLVLIFINSLYKLSAKKLLKNFRYVIVFSFVLAAIFTPTPDPFNQAIVAMPIIVLYFLSVILVWFLNKKR